MPCRRTTIRWCPSRDSLTLNACKILKPAPKRNPGTASRRKRLPNSGSRMVVAGTSPAHDDKQGATFTVFDHQGDALRVRTGRNLPSGHPVSVSLPDVAGGSAAVCHTRSSGRGPPASRHVSLRAAEASACGSRPAPPAAASHAAGDTRSGSSPRPAPSGAPPPPHCSSLQAVRCTDRDRPTIRQLRRSLKPSAFHQEAHGSSPGHGLTNVFRVVPSSPTCRAPGPRRSA